MKYLIELNQDGLIIGLYLDAPGYAVPPEGAVEIPQELGEQLRTQGFAGKQWVGGELQDAPPPPPPLAAWRAATLAKARSLRLPIMQVLDGMQASALVNGTMVGDPPQALAAVIETCKQALKDLPQAVNLGACTTREQMEGVVMLAYRAIVLAAPPEIKSAFDSLKP